MGKIEAPIVTDIVVIYVILFFSTFVFFPFFCSLCIY